MLTLKPETLTIKPRKTYQIAKGYPNARLVNSMPWLEISGSAKAEANTLSADAWQEWEFLSCLGLSGYVVRNTSQPKWGIISRDYLYSLAFAFEAKPVNQGAETDAHFEIIGDDLWWFPDSENDYPPLIGTTFSLSGNDLIANTAANLYLTGDAVFVDGFGAGYRLPCPNIDGFTHEPIERRVTQQFDSGRTRRNTKAAGVLHNLSCSFNMDIAEAGAWLSYYLRVLPEYIEADWLDGYFGSTKRLHLAAEPWELSATGTQFTLKINGMVVDG